MKIKRRLSDFPQKLKIFKAVEKGCSTVTYIDYVQHIDELEDCIVQALLDKDNDYFVIIEHHDKHNFYAGSTRINLTDDELWEKLDNMFKGATSFPMISYNLVHALKNELTEEIDEAKRLYEQHYGKL